MRARERYLHEGPGRFGDAELLALVVGTGAAGRSALEIAAGLLDRFGSVYGIGAALPQELSAVRGVGPVRAIRLHAALCVARRAHPPTDPASPVCCAGDAYAALGPDLQGLPHEELHALYLDRRRRPIARRVLTRGSDGFTIVDPRQIYRPAVALGAGAVVLAHNHPSGDPRPSVQDIDVTERVARAGRVLGAPLLDHIIVGGSAFVSLAEQGQLPSWTTPLPAWTA
ncbi:MAG: DNA repair protein RadC [Myxococcota bacterium]|jgi:DNA repair protein RadC